MGSQSCGAHFPRHTERKRAESERERLLKEPRKLSTSFSPSLDNSPWLYGFPRRRVPDHNRHKFANTAFWSCSRETTYRGSAGPAESCRILQSVQRQPELKPEELPAQVRLPAVNQFHRMS